MLYILHPRDIRSTKTSWVNDIQQPFGPSLEFPPSERDGTGAYKFVRRYMSHEGSVIWGVVSGQTRPESRCNVRLPFIARLRREYSDTLLFRRAHERRVPWPASTHCCGVPREMVAGSLATWPNSSGRRPADWSAGTCKPVSRGREEELGQAP